MSTAGINDVLHIDGPVLQTLQRLQVLHSVPLLLRGAMFCNIFNWATISQGVFPDEIGELTWHRYKDDVEAMLSLYPI